MGREFGALERIPEVERPRAEQVGSGTPRMGIGERGRKGELKARAARALKAQRR